MGNVILGALALALFQGIISRQTATSRVGGVIAGAGKAVEWFVSPAVPAFSSAASSTSSTALAVETAAGGSGASTAPPAMPASTPPAPSSSPFPFQIPGGPVVPALSA